MATERQGNPERTDAADRVGALEAELAQKKATISDLMRLHFQLHSILETVNEPVLIIHTAEDRVMECNRAAAEMLGRPLESLSGLDLAELDVDGLLGRLLGRTLTEGQSRDPSLALRRGDGLTIHVDVRTCRVDPVGKPLVFVALGAPEGNGRDRLGDSEKVRWYRDLFENTSDAVYATDRDGLIVAANPAFREILGVSRAELASGFNASELYADPSDRTRFQEAVETAGAVQDFDLRLRARDGTLFDFVMTSTVRRDGAGRVVGYQGILRDVTDRRNADRALRLTQFTLDQSPAAAFWVAPDGRILYVNDAACKLTGYDRRELLDLTVSSLDPKFAEGRWDDFWKIITRRGALTFESEHERKDGARTPVEFAASYLHFEEREYGFAFVRDLTERRRQEEEWRRSARRARRHETAIVELSAKGKVTQTGLDEAIRLITEVAARALQVERVSIWLFRDGRSRLECLDLFRVTHGKHSSGTVLDLDPDSAYLAALESGRAIDAADVLEDPRMSELSEGYWIPTGIASALDSTIRVSGEVVGVVCCEHVGYRRAWEPDEITFAAAIADQVSKALTDAERREAERAVREREEFLDAVVENIPHAVCVKAAADLRYVRVNRAWEEITGHSVEDVVGRSDAVLFPEDAERFAAQDREVLSTGRPIDVAEDSILSLDHGRRDLRTKLIPLFDPEGEVAWVLGILEDVTDRRRMELQLRHTEKMSALGQLVSGVAHELNNPMTAVLGFAQLLATRSDLPEPAECHVEKIGQEALRARRIVKNLLTFARQRQPERRRVYLSEIIERVLDLRSYELRVSNIEIVKDLAEDVPCLWADEDQLQQVVMNIVINAEQAILSDRDRGTISIRTDWAADESCVHLTIQNDGPAIPSGAISRVFDPFYTTKPEGQGTGLGLSISYAIVEQHEGRIRVEAEGDRGTSFVIELPRLKSEEAEVPEPAGPELGCPTGTILAVDDETAVLDLVRLTLEEEGHRVETAKDGKGAIRRLADGSFDAVISDLRMPNGSGIDIFRHCAENRPELAERFLFLTGDVISPETREQLDELGAPYLAKPFELEDLVAAVARVMSSFTCG